MITAGSFKRLLKAFITFLFVLPATADAQQERYTLQVDWDESSLQSTETPAFSNTQWQDGQPYFTKVIKLSRKPDSVTISPSFEFSKPKGIAPDSVTSGLTDSYIVNKTIGYERKTPYLTVSIKPLKKRNSRLSLLQTAQVTAHYSAQDQARAVRAKKGGDNRWPASSPLADGDWYRITIDTTGIFKLTYQDLKTLGIDVTDLPADELHLYGNGGRMLPQNNDNDHPKGLQANAIAVRDGGDGQLDEGDYILFYGEGSHGLTYNADQQKLGHEYHAYSDTTYYFLTRDPSIAPKRISEARSLSNAAYTTNTFDQLLFHEKEKLTEVNREVRTGRNWFGEAFSQQNRTRTFDFQFASTPQKVELRYRLAHHGRPGGSFVIQHRGKNLRQVSIPATETGYTASYTKQKRGTLQFSPNKAATPISLTYQSSGGNKGWLDYLSLTARSALQYQKQPLLFQDKQATNHKTVQYQLRGLTNSARVWDVTDANNVHRQRLDKQGSSASFTDSGQQLRRYLAFEPSDARSVGLEGAVANQNLHGLEQTDMLIVAHPRLMDQARALANFHQQEDGIQSHVVTPQAIYNEFSSGKQDVTAIRWFAKMFYDRADNRSEQPDHLLLFGDASYDYKDRVNDNTNLVPTYEARDISDPGSTVTDDYYGYLDDNEGRISQGNALLDINIGRIPVNTSQQAEQIVAKIKRYYNSRERYGSWQNTLTFIADDMEEGWEERFVKDSEAIIRRLNKEAPAYNVDKIYQDAFEQVTRSGGKRYPEVSKAITQRINEGSLLINYTGHGGEGGLASERVVTFEDIEQWDNKYRLPLLITATCEFTRFDDPGLVSAGERSFLKPDGGSIGLLSTTRLVYAGANDKLTRKVFEQNIFQRENGAHKTLGAVMTDAKNAYIRPGGDANNTRKFSLIGDPALTLAYPEQEVVTTRINQRPFEGEGADSLKALQKVTLKGEVRNQQGQRIETFNGEVYPKIYDKKVELQTLANDAAAKQIPFKLRNSVIYDGKTEVNNGRFEATFVVPKDISYELGRGKISYYATDYETDAHGYSYATVGGTAADPVTDDKRPQVDLYLNSRSFRDGGTTGPDPLVLADISDDNGINTAANGIGHQPELTIDGKRSITLDDAYQASLDTFNAGTLRHQLLDLEPGQHYLQLKVWDVTNKTGSDQLSFMVVEDQQLAIESLMNYPNPFSAETTIAFEHNQSGNNLTIRLNIYDIQGRNVASFERSGQAEASRETIQWKGTGAHGRKVQPGVYIYEVVLENDRGEVVQESSRLVIQK